LEISPDAAVHPDEQPDGRASGVDNEDAMIGQCGQQDVLAWLRAGQRHARQPKHQRPRKPMRSLRQRRWKRS
jgi:hypothetical protein